MVLLLLLLWLINGLRCTGGEMCAASWFGIEEVSRFSGKRFCCRCCCRFVCFFSPLPETSAASTRRTSHARNFKRQDPKQTFIALGDGKCHTLSLLEVARESNAAKFKWLLAIQGDRDRERICYSTVTDRALDIGKPRVCRYSSTTPTHILHRAHCVSTNISENMTLILTQAQQASCQQISFGTLPRVFYLSTLGIDDEVTLDPRRWNRSL